MFYAVRYESACTSTVWNLQQIQKFTEMMNDQELVRSFKSL